MTHDIKFKGQTVGTEQLEMSCHFKRSLWYHGHDEHMYSAKMKTSKYYHLQRMIATSTFIVLLLTVWNDGCFSVKGAYAKSTPRPSSSFPYVLPLHGDDINKHQVSRLRLFQWPLHLEYVETKYSHYYN